MNVPCLEICLLRIQVYSFPTKQGERHLPVAAPSKYTEGTTVLNSDPQESHRRSQRPHSQLREQCTGTSAGGEEQSSQPATLAPTQLVSRQARVQGSRRLGVPSLTKARKTKLILEGRGDEETP